MLTRKVPIESSLGDRPGTVNVSRSIHSQMGSGLELRQTVTAIAVTKCRISRPDPTQVAAGEAGGVDLEELVHLAHRLFSGAPVLRGAHVLEDGLLGLAGLFLFDRLVHRVVHGAPLGAGTVMLDESPSDRARDLDDLFLEEGGGAEGGRPGELVGQPAEEVD